MCLLHRAHVLKTPPAIFSESAARESGSTGLLPQAGAEPGLEEESPVIAATVEEPRKKRTPRLKWAELLRRSTWNCPRGLLNGLQRRGPSNWRGNDGMPVHLLFTHPFSLPRLLVTPVPAVVVGVYVMLRHGVSPAVIGLQVAAALLGAWGGARVARLPWDKVLAWAPALAVGGLLCGFLTLVSPGLEGVHRWWVLGPLRVHASSLLAPFVLLGTAVLFEAGRPLAAAGAVLLMQALHLVQPDAAQATALGAASLVLLSLSPGGPLLRWSLGSVVLLSTALAWGRPDPLLPVPHVEDIVRLAAEVGLLWGFAAVASLAVIPLGLALVGVSGWSRASPLERRVTASLAMYLGIQALTPAFGHFPVPVLGFGVSPLLGTWLSLGIVGVLGPRRGSKGSSTG